YHASSNGNGDAFGAQNTNYASLSRGALSSGLGTPFSVMAPIYGTVHGHGRPELYQANPYHVASNSRSSQVKSHSSTLPTPPPSLTRELDSCISKGSIATHV